MVDSRVSALRHILFVTFSASVLLRRLSPLCSVPVASGPHHFLKALDGMIKHLASSVTIF